MTRTIERSIVRVIICLSLVAVATQASVAVVNVSGPTSSDVQPAFDATHVDIQVHQNGSARWLIEFRTALETDEQAEQYRDFRAGFETNASGHETTLERRIAGTVSTASDETGREMEVRDVTASTSVQTLPRRLGLVVYQFTWHGFAATDGDELVVGDAFGSGFRLSDGDELTISAPPGYVLANAKPAPDESTSADADEARWTGTAEFVDRRPRVRMVSTAQGDDTAAPESTGTAIDESGSIVDGVSRSVFLGVTLGATAIGVLLLTFVAYPRSGGLLDWRSGGDTASVEIAAAFHDDPAVLTDEECVERLLAGRDGRVRQSAIVDALDWTDSKASRVLGSMAEEGRIEKIQIGRENLIHLPDGVD